MNKLVEPLKLTCTKFKANSGEKEYEKQDELKCSAMRAELANLFESIQKDSGDSLDNKMEEEMKLTLLEMLLLIVPTL